MDKIPVLLYHWFGSFQVYTIQTTNDIVANVAPTEYYWRDAGSPQGYGPFTGIVETMNHYTEYLRALTKVPGKKAADVIQVNFQTKRRV